MSKVFVGSLPWSIDNDSLKQEFERFGAVAEAMVILDRETNRSRGFGFVTFEDEEGAKKAIAEGDGMDVRGRNVSVAQSTERSGGGGGGRGFGGGRGGGGFGGGRGNYGGDRDNYGGDRNFNRDNRSYGDDRNQGRSYGGNGGDRNYNGGGDRSYNGGGDRSYGRDNRGQDGGY